MFSLSILQVKGTYQPTGRMNHGTLGEKWVIGVQKSIHTKYAMITAYALISTHMDHFQCLVNPTTLDQFRCLVNPLHFHCLVNPTTLDQFQCLVNPSHFHCLVNPTSLNQFQCLVNPLHFQCLVIPIMHSEWPDFLPEATGILGISLASLN